MTPEQFLKQVGRGLAPVYLFIGPESFQRGQCRTALIEAALSADEREQGFEHHDLAELSLAEAIDGARSMSLFASRRVIWVSGAECAMPKGRAISSASDDDDEDGAPKKGAAGPLSDYLADPVPGTVLVFESNRYDFDGDDRARTERVQKFYGAITNQVEFRPLTAQAALSLAQQHARAAGLKIGTSELSLLVESLGADAARIVTEIEKLRLYAGAEKKITAADIAKLVPNAQETTIFELVSALGSGNRARSLDLLDSLAREGEYMPLALSFLAGQFRMALVAQEAGLRSSADIQGYFTRMGVRIWRDRAEQVRQTISAFPRKKLELALRKLFEADRALRDARPDDRIVMEELILSLTA